MVVHTNFLLCFQLFHTRMAPIDRPHPLPNARHDALFPRPSLPHQPIPRPPSANQSFWIRGKGDAEGPSAADFVPLGLRGMGFGTVFWNVRCGWTEREWSVGLVYQRGTGFWETLRGCLIEMTR